jgi:hypothetical protein
MVRCQKSHQSTFFFFKNKQQQKGNMTEIELELDEDVLDEFNTYCIQTNQNRNTVLSSLLTDYINRRK